MMKREGETDLFGAARCWVKAAVGLWLLMIAFAFAASAQTTPTPKRLGGQQAAPPRPKEVESKPLAAHYDMVGLFKRLDALEAQVTELKKHNAALEAKVAFMNKQLLQASSQAAGAVATLQLLKQRFESLDAALRNHTHSMSSIGVMALSAIPGMQDLANKAGVGHVIQQWQGMKMLWTPGGSAGQTGTAILPGQ